MLIKTTPDKLPDQLTKRFRATPEMVARGLKAGAQRGRTILVRRTPKDRGPLRRGWRVVKRKKLISRAVYRIDLYNDAPYAGIVELGARPHPVSKEGFLSILGWVRRHRLGQLVGPVQQLPVAGPVQKGKRREVLQLAGKKVLKRRYYGDLYVGRRALEADVAWLIVRRLAKEGQKPTYFVRNSMPMLQRAVADEVKKVVSRLAKTSQPKPGGMP